MISRAKATLAVLCAAFAATVAVSFDRVQIAVPLYTPVFGEPRHVNIPQLAVIPLLAGIALALAADALGGKTSPVRAAWRGLAIGVFATGYAGLMHSVELLLGDPYFTAPYRLYADAFLALASFVAGWWLWHVARGRTRVADGELFSWPLLGTIAIVSVGALAWRELTPGGLAIAGAVLGAVAAERDIRPRVRITTGRVLIALLVLTFAFRVVFGLQVLARTGGGQAFAAASDDGPSYYDKAVALYANVGAASQGVLAADDGFPPAYSYFMTAAMAVSRGSLAGVVIAQSLVAVATALLLYLLGSRLRGPVVGLLAAGIFATDQNVIQDGATLTPESILLPLVLLAIWAADTYRRRGRARWLMLAAVAVGLAFITRNIVGGSLAFSLAAWLVLVERASPLRAARDAVTTIAAVLVFSVPVVLATAAAGGPRLTNQLAGVAYSLKGHPEVTVENTFLVDRGIDPFRDAGGSLRRFAQDPFPVIAFEAGAAPQRIRALLFYAPSGAADPVAVVTPTQYPNPYGQLLEMLTVVALLISVVAVVRRPPWRIGALAGILLIYVLVYLALFAFLFPPDHPFRYRIPIEPVSWLAEAIGLVVLVRASARRWLPDRA